MSTQIWLSQDLTRFATPESIVLHRPAHLLGGYTLLSPSLHAQCTSSRSRRGITRLSLPRAGDQYYKVSTQQAINGSVLNRHSWRHYFKTPCLKQVHRPVSSWNIIDHKGIPQQPFKLSYLKTYLISRSKHHYVVLNKTGAKDKITNIKVVNATIRLNPIPDYVMQPFHS